MKRRTDYPTGNESGMGFICNRWVFTGGQGWRVVDNGDGTHTVTNWHGRPCYGGLNLAEDAAHEYAARLARTTPHPKPEPEHTCGPGITYGCDVPDCDGENGD